MLNSIAIKNFRCFEKLKVTNFRNVNLIGGENNAGKTALLEALLLTIFPNSKSMALLHGLRNQSIDAPQQLWNYLFYYKRIQEVIELQAELTNGTPHELSFTIQDNYAGLSNLLNGQERFTELLSSKFDNMPILNIKGQVFENGIDYYLLYDQEENDAVAIGRKPANYEFSPFIYPCSAHTNKYLANLYSKVKENKKINVFNEVLTLLDKRIISSEIDFPGSEPLIQLILDNDESLPLRLFGDAVRKIAEVFLVLLSSESPIILIDEIENGIHFTKHEELWLKIFQVMRADMQLFVTSHSAEMIKAFNEAACYTDADGDMPYLEKTMYFEMFRDRENSEIGVNQIDMEMLNYQIAANNPYRGE